MRAFRRARPSRPPGLRAFTCQQCASPVTVAFGGTGGTRARTKFCSDECSLKASYARRAQRRSGVVITADQVGERDGWTCGICALPVDRSIAWPEAGAPTVDHIVPLGRGGKHALDNVRLAHWSCNQARGLGEYSRTGAA